MSKILSKEEMRLKYQEKLIKYLLVKDVIKRTHNIIKPEYFSTTYRDMIKEIKESYQNNQSVNVEVFNGKYETNLQPLTDGEIDYTVSKITEYCKDQAKNIAMEKIHKIWEEKGDFSNIENIVKQAHIEPVKPNDMASFWDVSTWEDEIDSNRNEISTGWSTFDDITDGGYGFGELNYVCAPPSGGKSLCMQQLAINWSILGYNVVYFTLELSKNKVCQRLATMITGVSQNQFKNNPVARHTALKTLKNTNNKLTVIDMPNPCTTNDIQARLEQLENDTNSKVQIVIIDYADLMKPNYKEEDTDISSRDHAITLQLRAMATNRTIKGDKTMVFTATQLTKPAMSDDRVTMSDLAGGAAKSRNADNIFYLHTNDVLKQRGEYYISFLKARNSNANYKQMKLTYNIDTLEMRDGGTIAENKLGKSTEILNKIKK